MAPAVGPDQARHPYKLDHHDVPADLGHVITAIADPFPTGRLHDANW